MKRSMRLTLRVLGVCILLLGGAAVLCLDGVDYAPYVRAAYYADTTARLRAQVQTNTVVRGDLLAGFGCERLSPTVNLVQDAPLQGGFRSLPLAGYGGRHGKPAKGVHDDLQVKAVAFKVQGRTGVIAGVDALIIPPEVADEAARRLQEELGLTREQLYLGATHTHSSLGAWGQGMVAESFAGGFQPAVRTWFADRIVAAVRDAVRDLRPARFGHGEIPAPAYVRNRLLGASGKVDPGFCYSVVEQEGGRRAVLGVYGAHATVLSSDMMEFSADYPGSWQRAVEKATGGMALFIAGAVGSQAPVPGARGLEGTERMGQGLAQLLIDRLPQTSLTNVVTLGLIGLDVTMPPLNVRLSDGFRLRPWLASRLVPARSQSFLQVLRINDAVWVSTPCDFSGELSLEIKDFLRARGASGIVTSFNGDYVGYVIPARYYHLSGYEPRLMSFFGPNVPDYFAELIQGLALPLISK